MTDFEQPVSYDVSAGASRLRIDAGKSGSFTFTVTNKRGTPLNTGVKVRVEGDVQESWCTIENGADRVLEPNDGVQYTVRVAVPEGTPTGSSKVTLVSYYVDDPSNVFMRGPWVQVDHTTRTPTPIPKWLVAALVGAGVLIVGLVAFLIFGSSGDLRPDLTARSEAGILEGKTLTGLSPLAVNFKAEASKAPSSWQWVFGGDSKDVDNPDGSKTTETEYVFKEPGQRVVYVIAKYPEPEEPVPSLTMDVRVDPRVEARMAVANSVGNSPLKVEFKDISDATKREWDFDIAVEPAVDSTEQSVTHTYTNDGTSDKTFTAKLKVSGAGEGNTSEATEVITVRPKSKADFGVSRLTGYAPLTIQCTDTSQAPGSWSWDFGGQGTSPEQHPKFTFQRKGEYVVRLKLGTGESAEKTVKVYEKPKIDFNADKTAILTGDTVTFTWDTTGDATSTTIDFGDGNNFKTRLSAIRAMPGVAIDPAVRARPRPPAKTAQHIYKVAGSYEAKLIVQDPVESQTAIKKIVVKPRPGDPRLRLEHLRLPGKVQPVIK